MTTLRTPDPVVDRAFALALDSAESLLGGPPGSPGALSLVGALLGAGVRAPARRLLAAASATEAAHIGGLAARYDAWVGDGPAGAPGRAAPATPTVPLETAVAAALSEPRSPAAMAGLLDAVILGLWGVQPDARAGAVTLRPALPSTWRSMALTRLRVGRSILDFEVRRRRENLSVHVRRAAGPSVVLTLEPRPALPGPTVVNDVELQGGRARFEVTDTHDVLVHGSSE